MSAKEKPVSFLHNYISNLKNNDHEVESQKEQMRKKVQGYDDACLTEL